ncbi:MAG: GIY-YIG nuclease family protein [Spirochaetes bacterium]|nr:GIY-YIG nuclease family protein [Spirochaetota bacterium]
MIEKENYLSLPNNPGVYIFYDKNRKILYIGKAKYLKKRVSQYFNSKYKDLKTINLTKKVKFIDYLITKSEKEAILVEQNLISVNNPPYNIQLKDNKSFPVIVLTEERFPAVHLSRQYNCEKGFISGPYLSSRTAKTVYNFVLENFKIRSCSKKLNKISKPCLNYHLKLCCAPCGNFIDEESYKGLVEKAKNFLRGAYNDLLKKLKEEINKYSENLEFEKALELKNIYEKIENFKKDFSYNYFTEKVVDFIGFYFGKNYGIIAILRMSKGRKILPYTKYFKYYDYPKNIFEEIVIKLYEDFLKFQNFILPEEIISLYQTGEIFLENIKAKNDKINYIIQDFLISNLNVAENNAIYKLDNQAVETTKNNNPNFENSNSNNKILFVRKYKNNKELDILKNLVKHCKTFYFETFPEESKANISLLKSIKNKLGLEKFPEIIEGYDISNLGDKYIVGAEVNFINGIKNKKEYRHFAIKLIDYQNDVEAITEIVLRRIIRLQNENKRLPDLILIDGGKPQTNSVYEALKKLGFNNDIIGLAKKEELIYIPARNELIKLDINLPEMRMLIYIRDEAHRFANRLRKIKIKKKFNF